MSVQLADKMTLDEFTKWLKDDQSFRQDMIDSICSILDADWAPLNRQLGGYRVTFKEMPERARTVKAALEQSVEHEASMSMLLFQLNLGGAAAFGGRGTGPDGGDHGRSMTVRLDEASSIQLATRIGTHVVKCVGGTQRSKKLGHTSRTRRGRVAYEAAKKIPFSTLKSSGPSVADPTGIDENGVVQSLRVQFERSLQRLPGYKLVWVADSHKWCWVPQGDTPSKDDLSPDNFVMHSAFIESSDQNNKPALGVLLFYLLRSIFEGKFEDVKSNDAMGQVVDYAVLLEEYCPCLHVCFFADLVIESCSSRRSFWLTRHRSERVILCAEPWPRWSKED
eukprot:m.353778 g.353778  ORF g.353778 m.353778 type:complete len:336 (+) comp16593_c2_seq30:559-1566(+)